MGNMAETQACGLQNDPIHVRIIMTNYESDTPLSSANYIAKERWIMKAHLFRISPIRAVLLLAVLFLTLGSFALAEGRIVRVDYDSSQKYVGETVWFTIQATGVEAD